MKHVLILLIGLSAMLIASCKGDDPAPVKKFADYTRADIMAAAANITNEAIPYDAPAVQNFKAGSIIFFKTSSANYGKLEVISVDVNKQLTANVVVYDASGASIVSKNAFLMTVSGDAYDMDDADMPMVLSADGDMAWASMSGFNTLYFANNARAYLFKP